MWFWDHFEATGEFVAYGREEQDKNNENNRHSGVSGCF